MRGRVSPDQLAFSFDEPAAAALPYTVVCDDVLKWAEETPPIGAHAMLVDPPYELGFMGKSWDRSGIAFKPETWKALAQHLLPGAFILAFGSSRGWHRLACAMEDAGLRIYPSIFGWLGSQAFPKATRIDSQVDRRKGFEPGFERTVTRYLREARNSQGLTNTQLADLFGFDSRMAAHWCAEETDSQPAIPRLEHWDKLKRILNLDDRFDEAITAYEREVIGHRVDGAANGSVVGLGSPRSMDTEYDETAPATPLAQTWAGHRYGGQVLKNSLEPIIVAQVPYAGKPVQSIVEHGSGAMWIDGARLSGTPEATRFDPERHSHEGWRMNHNGQQTAETAAQQAGRWPSNFLLQHHPECVAQGTRQVNGSNRPGPAHAGDFGKHGTYGQANGDLPVSTYTDANGMEEVPAYQCHESCVVRKLDLQAGYRDAGGQSAKPGTPPMTKNVYGHYARSERIAIYHDSGSASRFFMTADWSLDVAERLAQADPALYCAKASRSERDAGLVGMSRLQDVHNLSSNACGHCGLRVKANGSGVKCECGPERETIKLLTTNRNGHPTVKPIKLTQWLATLLLPPATYAPRRLLIPFSGSGSEGIGALLAGWDEIVMVDSEQSYVDIAQQRLTYWSTHRGATP